MKYLMCNVSDYCRVSVVERQKALPTSHINIQLDPFASSLTACITIKKKGFMRQTDSYLSIVFVIAIACHITVFLRN